MARYDAVIALHREGHSHAAISRQTGLGRRTVRRYLRAGAFPERAAGPARPTLLAPYAAYLRARWTGGCHNAQQLWREIRSRGYAGQAANVRRYLARWRPAPGRPGPTVRRDRADHAPPTPPVRQPTPVPSPRQARWLLLRAMETPTPEERAYRAALLDAEPSVRQVRRLVADFGTLVRTRDAPGLIAWLARADASGLPEVRSFAAGIRRDRAAVDAALSSPWSNGQTEGQINRLKVLKRQMHGRAKLDRWLAAADETTRNSGWSLVGAMAMIDESIPDSWFADRLAQIERTIHGAPRDERYHMNNALISIGCRNASLRKSAAAAAKRLNAIEVDHGDTNCRTPEALECIENVTSGL